MSPSLLRLPVRVCVCFFFIASVCFLLKKKDRCPGTKRERNRLSKVALVVVVVVGIPNRNPFVVPRREVNSHTLLLYGGIECEAN